MPGLLSTVAKRKALAAHVSEVATRILGFPVKLKPCDLHKGEFIFRREDTPWETDRGPAKRMSISISPRGVNMHSAFSMPQFAPSGSNPFTGKWNAYAWHDDRDDAQSLRDHVETVLIGWARHLRPNGATRQDQPDQSGLWAKWREEFAADCAAARAEGIDIGEYQKRRAAA